MSTIAYKLSLYNVAPRVGGLVLIAPYTVGSGFLTLNFTGILPTPPFRLTVVTLASRGTGINEILTVFKVVAITGNTLTLDGTLEGTSDQNFSIGDIAELRDNSGAITDLNNAVLSLSPTVITGVVAAGNSQGTATPLLGSSSIQEVISVPSGSGVVLPTPVLPSSIKVINSDVNPLLVYPAIGNTIFNGNTPVSVAALSSTEFVASSSTNWYDM